jgi:hypothetical protein
MVSVARKQSKTEEQCYDQNCLFRQGRLQKQVTARETLLGSSPMNKVAVARKLSIMKEQRQDSVSTGRLQGQRPQPRKLTSVRMPVKMVSN